MLNGILFLAVLPLGRDGGAPLAEYEPEYRKAASGASCSRARSTPSVGIKPVKTEVPRWVPVHPTLAKMLAAWRRKAGKR